MSEEQHSSPGFVRVLRILFIGNSHTYRHDVPSMFVRMAAVREPAVPVAVESCDGEGASLAWHWENPKTVRAITKGNWNYVVLQERSGGPIEDQPSMEKYALNLDRRIRDSGARTILYMTWPRREKPETQSVIAAAYSGLQRLTGALLAPVGSVWRECCAAYPDLDLYDPDGRHANALGAYLSACTFFSLICGRSPEGLSEAVLSRGDGAASGGAEHLASLERIAHEMVERLRLPSF